MWISTLPYISACDIQLRLSYISCIQCFLKTIQSGLPVSIANYGSIGHRSKLRTSDEGQVEHMAFAPSRQFRWARWGRKGLLGARVPSSRTTTGAWSGPQEKFVSAECLGQYVLCGLDNAGHTKLSREETDSGPNLRVDGTECCLFQG